jgi:hypothetical protein
VRQPPEFSALQLSPVAWLVCPFTSGRVVQLSCPTVWASTNTWSQLASVSYEVQKDIVAPPAGTLIVCASRLYVMSAIWE